MNVNRFRGKIVEKGMNVEVLSERMGIHKSNVYRKMNNNGDTFTLKEVRKIIEILDLTAEETRDIFFDNTVA